MISALRRIFAGSPTPAMAHAIVSAQREALFTPSYLEPETRRIYPRAASLEEIQAALEDCDLYWATAYPETENDLVLWIEAACYDEIDRRLRGTLRDGFIKQLPPTCQHEIAAWRRGGAP